MTHGSHDPLGTELGKLAVEMGYLSAEELATFENLQVQLGGRHHLGALLVARGALSEQQLHELLAAQKQGGAAAGGGAAQSRRSPPVSPAQHPAAAQSSSDAPAEGGHLRKVGAPVSAQGFAAYAAQQTRVPASAGPQSPVERQAGTASQGALRQGHGRSSGESGAYGASRPGPASSRVSSGALSGVHSGAHSGSYSGSQSGAPSGSPAGSPIASSSGLPSGSSIRSPSGTPSGAPIGSPSGSPSASEPRQISSRIEPLRPSRPAAAEAQGSKLVRLLQMAERARASDVHIHASSPPAIRVEGQLKTVTGFQLDAREQEQLILELLSSEQRKTFLEENDLDLAIVTPTGLRCRTNVYRTQFGVDATFRLIRRNPPTLSELGLPETLARLTESHQGMVLVTGPAGSGKSTTLAALVDLLNTTKAKHILSLEDPIEIVHPEKMALVNQRQVGRDTQSFARALRGALREDPDIIVIGELRDRETISLAVTAAETGHLVLGSMHTNSAARTVARILDAFPPSQQSQVRAMVSESLKGVVSQRLVQGVDGKRVPAAEILMVTPAVSNLIREGKLYQIRSMMQTGRLQGMRTLDDALRELVAEGRISQEEAAKHMESAQQTTAAPPPSPADNAQQQSADAGSQTAARPQAGQRPTARGKPSSAPAKPAGGFASFLRGRRS